MSTGSKKGSAKRKRKHVADVHALIPKDATYFKIVGDPEGLGPFEWGYTGVSLQMIAIIEHLLVHLKEELVQIIQTGGVCDEENPDNHNRD